MNYNCLMSFPFEQEILFHVNIKELHLRGNQFQHFKIPMIIFLTMKHIVLEYIDLSFNKLVRFENHGLPVKNILVTNNRLVVFEYLQFGTIPVTVEAQFNNISKVASNAIYLNFNLSHNSLTSFNEISMTNSAVQGVLDLSYNKITMENKNIRIFDYDSDEYDYIDSNFRPIFRQQHAVNFLNLSYNQIENFSNLKAMERYKHTSKIDLQGNKISALSLPIVKKSFGKLNYLNVKGNPVKKYDVEGIQYNPDGTIKESILMLEVDEGPVFRKTTLNYPITSTGSPETTTTASVSNSTIAPEVIIQTSTPSSTPATVSTVVNLASHDDSPKKGHPVAMWISIFLALLVIPAVLYFAYFRAKWSNLRYTRSTFNEAENML